MTVNIFQNIFDSVQAPLSVHSWARLYGLFDPLLGFFFVVFLVPFLGCVLGRFWFALGRLWGLFWVPVGLPGRSEVALESDFL